LLTSLGLQIKRHWKEYRPKMLAALEQAGRLGSGGVRRAGTDRAGGSRSRPEGAAPRELFPEEWVFLPNEEDAMMEWETDAAARSKAEGS
jgi:hypothetical protein